MALLEISVEQIMDLIQQLPRESQQSVAESLNKQLAEERPESEETASEEMDEESRLWLEADLAGELPEYDWGPEGVPEGVPVVCTEDGRIVILGADKIGS